MFEDIIEIFTAKKLEARIENSKFAKLVNEIEFDSDFEVSDSGVVTRNFETIELA